MKDDFGTVGEDGCPCGEYDRDGFIFDIHCWRSGCNVCDFSGIHIIKYPKGKLTEARRRAKKIKKYIEDSYYTDCKIVIGGRKLKS